MITNYHNTEKGRVQEAGGEIVNKIKQMREASGLSQRELAGKLGVTQGAVARWELGLADPTVLNLIALAQILDCSTDALLGRTPT